VAEVSEKLSQLTETEIVTSFREALVTLFPILQRLDCISDDTQPYDPFDAVAEALWNVLVVESLRWKHGLDAAPQLPRYGFWDSTPGPAGYIEVRSSWAEPFRLIEFLGDRELGPEPFNSVRGVSATSQVQRVPFDGEISFGWRRVSR